MCLVQKQSKPHQPASLVKWVYLRKQSGSSYLSATGCRYNSADLTKCLTSINVAQSKLLTYWEEVGMRVYQWGIEQVAKQAIGGTNFSPTHSTRHIWMSFLCRYGSHQNFSPRGVLVSLGTVCYRLTQDWASSVDKLTSNHEEDNTRILLHTWYWSIMRPERFPKQLSSLLRTQA